MSTWSRDPLRPFPSMTTCEASSAIFTKTTASSINSSVFGEAMTSKCLSVNLWTPLDRLHHPRYFHFLNEMSAMTQVLMIFHRHVLTGSYHNYFRIYDVDTLNDVVLQADKSAFKAKKIGGPLPGAKPGVKNGPRAGGLRDAMQLETLDFNKKILHASWHPRENTIAVCRFPSGMKTRVF